MHEANQYTPLNELANNELQNKSSGQHNTLKNRIKRTMVQTDSSSRRRESVLDAASALASLGGSPRTPDTSYKTIQNDRSAMIGVRMSENNTQALPFPSSLRGDTSMTFPEKLMEVLSNDQISDIITWLPHGKGFTIVQKRKFASEVMPLYFKQTKFTSFTRKLNRWGFTRVANGPETGAYYHEYFHRGNHLRCMQMHCQPSVPLSKGTSNGTRTQSPFSRHPDTTYPRILPLPVDDNWSTEKSKSSVDHHRVSFDLVLHRQRQLLKESQLGRCSDSSSLAGRDSGFDDIFDEQQKLLHTKDKCHSRDIYQPSQPQDLLQEKPRLVAETQRLLRHSPSSSRRYYRHIADKPRRTLMMNPGISAENLPDILRSLAAARIERKESICQAQLHSAMHAQLRKLEKQNKNVEDALKNDQRCPSFSQHGVARLYNEIGQRAFVSEVRRAPAA